MKRIITLFSLVFLFAITSGFAQCCNNAAKLTNCAQASNCAKSQNVNVSDAKVYYFHASRRCATCMAVEDVTKAALKEYYGEKISFSSVNNEEDKSNPMIEKYKISGQTLIIVKGEKVIDLTNDAFLYARTNPDKLKAKIKATVESLK